ncbi:MAG: tryptophan synthase subunit alpha [Candidatus Magnetoovum sp. WYHC-5]|nr:tryptophan synthase subunit alpha [Candidatus Magnetoovum sp. WYHC-5]
MYAKTRISAAFDDLINKKAKAFIPYIMAGDPDLDKTAELVLTLEDCGADIIELGVPFSDPLADGPTIQRAAERALAKGVTLKKVLTLVSGLRKKTNIPIVLMTYYNPVFKYGGGEFIKDATECGVDGIIVPDLLPDEEETFITNCKTYALDTIFLLAPTSTTKRVQLAAIKSTGFIYYVSITGITGANIILESSIAQMVNTIRETSQKPVAVGFGIKTPAEARQVARIADGVIVGSSIVKAINDSSLDELKTYIRALTEAIKTAPDG